jgi:hypothetical protein
VRVVLTALAVALATTPAAEAGTRQKMGCKNGQQGCVVNQWAPPPPPNRRSLPGYEAGSACWFNTVLLPNNTYLVSYGGAALGESVVVPPRVPQQIILECRISNGIGNIASFSWTNGGAAATHTDSVTGWPVSPITICTRALAFWGPTDPVLVDIGYACDEPILS